MVCVGEPARNPAPWERRQAQSRSTVGAMVHGGREANKTRSAVQDEIKGGTKGAACAAWQQQATRCMQRMRSYFYSLIGTGQEARAHVLEEGETN